MPSIGNGLRLIPIDRTTPIGTGGTPIIGNAYEVSIENATLFSETYCRLSVFLIAVACKDFPTAPSLAAYSCSPRGETVISRLRSLSAYHRLAFPGLYSSILSVFQ